MHLERELKWALLAAEHAQLGALLTAELGAGVAVLQVNRFFDAADLRLRRARMNVRLRWEQPLDGEHNRARPRLMLTCKRKPPGAGELGAADAGPSAPAGLAVHDEWEHELDAGLRSAMECPVLPDDAAVRLGLPDVVRTVLGSAPLLPLGGFTNQRTTFTDGSALLCLDRTEFTAPPSSARVDCELEIETADPVAADRRWRARFAAWGIPVIPQPLTKFARFLALR